jgi:hypothetical protein
MGNFSEDRLPEMVLRVIYQFMLDAGFRAPINASLKARGASRHKYDLHANRL